MTKSAVALGLTLVACGSSSSKSSSTSAAGIATTAGGGSTAVSLKGDCPDTIVIQTDWFPEAEHGALYQMVGSDYKVDTKKRAVSGTLVGPGGADTGVKIEIRSGGPSVGFQSPEAIMATDSSITMGYAGTSSANNWGKTPLIQVMAPLEKNPQMIMWDPATYPNVKTIDDLAKAGVSVNVFSKDVMLFFVNDGRYPDKLVDPSYDGSPSRFVAQGGKIAQQGFASAEPYVYEHELPQWNKPVAFQTFYDAGYQDYSQTLGVRPSELDKLRPCLKKFIPIVQHSVVDYANSPDRANAIIVDAVKQYADFWKYSPELAKWSVDQQKKLGLIGNGPDSTVGNFDLERVQKYIDEMVKTGKFSGIPAGFKAETMVNNEFIDPSIGFK